MKQKKKGFTLIEIMVVVAIVGILASFATFAVLKSAQNSRVKVAESELHLIASGVLQMAWDTGKWPDGASRAGPVGSNNEIMNLSGGALFENSADDPDWKGPYYEGALVDPWGQSYFFDSDYRVGGVDRVVVGSGGPNKSGKNIYDEDNIWVALDDFNPQTSADE